MNLILYNNPIEGKEEEEGLDGVVAPVDEVAQEEVVLVGALASDLEQFDQVVELAVDVATYLGDDEGGEREKGRR